MATYLWLAIGLAVLIMLLYRAGRVWVDAGRGSMGPFARLGWALLGTVFPTRYWWGKRVQAMSPQQRDDLLIRETALLGLSRADSLRCPLCGAEVPSAWVLAANGQATIARGPIQCPRCDFRLDACRHCTRFLPGPPQGWAPSPWSQQDLTFGRCNHHKSSQPVEQACAPEMARQLKARGYTTIRAPMPISDSYLPPDSCTAFVASRARLQTSGVPWPRSRRVALLRLLASPDDSEAAPTQDSPLADEEWLL